MSCVGYGSQNLCIVTQQFRLPGRSFHIAEARSITGLLSIASLVKYKFEY